MTINPQSRDTKEYGFLMTNNPQLRDTKEYEFLMEATANLGMPIVYVGYLATTSEYTSDLFSTIMRQVCFDRVTNFIDIHVGIIRRKFDEFVKSGTDPDQKIKQELSSYLCTLFYGCSFQSLNDCEARDCVTEGVDGVLKALKENGWTTTQKERSTNV